MKLTHAWYWWPRFACVHSWQKGAGDKIDVLWLMCLLLPRVLFPTLAPTMTSGCWLICDTLVCHRTWKPLLFALIHPRYVTVHFQKFLDMFHPSSLARGGSSRVVGVLQYSWQIDVLNMGLTVYPKPSVDVHWIICTSSHSMHWSTRLPVLVDLTACLGRPDCLPWSTRLPALVDLTACLGRPDCLSWLTRLPVWPAVMGPLWINVKLPYVSLINLSKQYYWSTQQQKNQCFNRSICQGYWCSQRPLVTRIVPPLWFCSPLLLLGLPSVE